MPINTLPPSEGAYQHLTVREKINEVVALVNQNEANIPVSGEVEYETLLTSRSNANQDPTGAGHANAVQITFGNVTPIVTDDVTLEPNGNLVLRTAGQQIKCDASFQYGRSTNTGYVDLKGYLTYELPSNPGVEVFVENPVSSRLDNAKQGQPFYNELLLTAPEANTIFRFYLARDTAQGGISTNGGLRTYSSGEPYGNTASAEIICRKMVGNAIGNGGSNSGNFLPFPYMYQGNIMNPTVLRTDASFISATGYCTGTENDVYLVGFECMAATSSAAAAGTLTIQLRQEDKNANTQHVVGSGALVKESVLLSASGVTAVSYNACGQDFFTEAPVLLADDKMFFVDVTAAEVNVTDLKVIAYLQVVPR